MKDRVSQRQLLNLQFRNDFAKLFLDILPFILAPEIVEKDEAAPHDVLTQARGLLVGQFHEAGLDDVDDRIVKDAIVEYFKCYWPGCVREVCTGPFTHAVDKAVECFGIG